MVLPEQWRRRPNPEIVDAAESLLEAAKDGLAQTVIIIAINPLHEPETSIVGDLSTVHKHVLVSGLFAAAHTLLQKLIRLV